MRALALVSSSRMRALALVSSSRMWALPLVSSERTSVKEARRKIRGTNSMHWCNVADDIPCDMDVGGCELTGACDNQVLTNDVEVLAAEWLCDDKERGQPQKGLYYTGK
jgi:hypothetical protein